MFHKDKIRGTKIYKVSWEHFSGGQFFGVIFPRTVNEATF